MSGLALRTVQEELANLMAAGLLTSWSNGYHRFYQANREHELYSFLRRVVQASARLPRVMKQARLKKRKPPRRPAYRSTGWGPIRRPPPTGGR